MSEAKFTKEEWFSNGRLISSDGEFIATVSDTDKTWPETQANAHLIAAAPELYRAIENLLVELDSKHGISLESMIGVGLRRCLEDAYYSLAKARGEV